MKKILVENKFGHGGKRQPIRRQIRRIIRPMIGKSSIPFDWNIGIHVQTKLGKIPVKNQGISDSCGGQAKSYWLGIIIALLNNAPYVEQSAKSIYSLIFYLGGGTTIPAMEKDLGSLNEFDLPSYQSGLTPSEAFMESTMWKNPDTLKKMMVNQGWQAISVGKDMESIAQAIRDYGAVIWEIDGQNNGTWLSNNPKPPQGNLSLWAHFMCSEGAGIWNNQKAITMFQSWGSTVGDNGLQHFTQDYIGSGYILDVFTFVKASKFLFTNDLSYGIQNNDVLQLQKRLGVWQTGYFGALTYAAVRIYQLVHGIPETGYVGTLTRTSLNSN